MLGILRDMGLTVHAEPCIGLGAAAEFGIVDEDCPVIYHGSLRTLDEGFYPLGELPRPKEQLSRTFRR